MGKTRKPLWKLPQHREKNGPCRKCIDGICPNCKGKGCRKCKETGRCECSRKVEYAY